MKSRNVLVASAVAVMMLAAGCSSGSGAGTPRLNTREDQHRRRRVPRHRLGRPLHRPDRRLVRRPGAAGDDRARQGPPAIHAGPDQRPGGWQVRHHRRGLRHLHRRSAGREHAQGEPAHHRRGLLLAAERPDPAGQGRIVDKLGQPAQEEDRLGQRTERHRHPAGRFPARGARPQTSAGALRQRAVPGCGGGSHDSEEPRQRVVRPRAVRQPRRGGRRHRGARRPRPGLPPRTSRSRATRSRGHGRRSTPTP